jgi:hypothetical protein
MPVVDLASWIDQWARPGTVWFTKRLSGNDTLANGSHQAGPYIPKEFLFEVFPQINQPEKENPDDTFALYVDSHPDYKEIRVVWYNNRVRKNPLTGKPFGTRNETRLTNFGGQESALLNPDSTGALAVFVFVIDQQDAAQECHVWVCDNELEEELVESHIGPVEPRQFVVWRPGFSTMSLATAYLTTISPAGPASCRLPPGDIPPAWLTKFPTGEEIVQKTRELRPDSTLAVDDRLLRRRACEFEVFKSVEEAFYTPKVASGFPSLEAFLSLAQTILQSRKSRSGKSLEFHARDIFKEEALVPETNFSHGPLIEGTKRPDFLFPSAAMYNDGSFPKERLRMLAAKTTCKDRWRQVINEADRIDIKHLLTLQEGVSENQFREMVDAKVKLVVPSKLHDHYPDSVKPHLITLESFIAEVRLLTV